MHRRDFVRSAALAGAAGCLTLPQRAGASTLELTPMKDFAHRNGLGLQLWTVRNQMEADPEATLKSVAQAGYQQVELMSVVDSQEIVKMAKAEGLEVRSAFFNWETVVDPDNPNVPKLDDVIEISKQYGLEYLVFGYIGKSARDTADKLRSIADNTNAVADKVKQAGMKLSYHNHSFEFEPLESGTTGFDIFIERFDKQLVNFELDVFWAALGGWDPIKTLQRLGNRVGQVHLKDLKKGSATIYDEGNVPEDAFQEVGDGIIDMKQVLKVASESGVTQFHVEQDQSPDPLASIEQSFSYVKSIW